MELSQSNNSSSISRVSSSSTILTESDDETYVMKAKLCNRLSKEFNLQEICYDILEYEPPTEPGLSNCDVIIPSYYHLANNPENIFKIDYYEIIKDDIRNMRPLNGYQLEYIKQLSHEQKNELLELFNACISTVSELL